LGGGGDEVVVSYIAITEHTSLWEISGSKYSNLQKMNKSACIHPNYWIETTLSLYFTRSVLLRKQITLTTRKTPHS